MRLTLTAADENFRAGSAASMRPHLVGKYRSLKHLVGPGEQEADTALGEEWTLQTSAAGRIGVAWHKDIGGG